MNAARCVFIRNAACDTWDLDDMAKVKGLTALPLSGCQAAGQRIRIILLSAL